jgi:hypothetical protein
MAEWPPDGTAAARAAEMRPAVPYNDRGRRLKNLTEAVALRENDLAQAQRASSNGESKARRGQIAGRLHRARMELAEFHAANRGRWLRSSRPPQ